MQRQIILETTFEGRKRAEVARRLGISVNTDDNHLQAAFRSLRDSMAQVVDISTHLDRPLWYDRVEEIRDRYEATRLRRASGSKRSTHEGERSAHEGERGKSLGSAAA